MEKHWSLCSPRPRVNCACGVLLCALTALTAALCPAQSANPTSASNPYFGSVVRVGAADEPLRLSLVDAVELGLRNNLGLKQAENAEENLEGQKKRALQAFLPALTLEGGTGVYEHDLVTMGFTASKLSQFTSLFPSGLPAGFSSITKDDLTYGQVDFQQILFSGPVVAGWRSASASTRASHFATVSARGRVVDQVAQTYLRALAASSQVDAARALESADQLAYEQARAAHEAGVVAKLDLLRAQLQLQTQQLTVVAAQNELEKTLILLKREIGVAPAQTIALTDPAPYSELARRSAAELLPSALENRMDYQSLKNQAEAARAAHAAYRSRRLPSLSFGGYWGVDRVNGAGARSNFAAVGSLTMPLFREAGLRGDEQASAAQSNALNAQLADLRERVDEQLRAALLDVDAAEKQVGVARSKVELAARALSDESERVAAGVDDNLPLVTAQAGLAAAQSDLIERLYQWNVAKLELARAAGVVELQYRDYLGMQ
jgi:outer membrane protein TolC